MKDPDNPKQFIPNPETSPIVKHIFEMYASGIGIVKICDRLSAEKVVFTSVYAFQRTGSREILQHGRAEKVQIEKRIKKLDSIICCLYEDRVCGRLSPDRYDVMAGRYEQKQAELKQELQSITKRIDEMYMREMCIREFIAKAKEYLGMSKLTPELLRVFVRRIEVYEKAEKYSRTCGNPIVIHYAFQLPEQNGMPVIEKVMQPATMSA